MMRKLKILHRDHLETVRTLIIGGSSRLGFAVASGALANGSKVHITPVTTEKLSTKIEIQSLYPNAHTSPTQRHNIQSMLDVAVKETGGVIVYTAGDSRGSETLAKATAASALKHFTVRYLGPLLVGKLVAANPGKYLNSATSSSIILTSGVLAHRPRPGNSPMIGPAGAVEVLTRVLAVDLAPIRVNVVIPGLLDTELVQGMVGGNTALLSASVAASLTKKIGTPEGTAEAYLFSMRSALATGQGFKIGSGGLLVLAVMPGKSIA
ncbi:short chain dehydrogenase [Mycena albidolilacea]|uniref:Short chain dehydrogenase n=1 Tax=Mycena albidolilacea TaxID=1033008 RepID=A0AAD7ASF4_9AGAR|nr:short chain dehydrogenase [Mycena albidolilacea]